MLYSTFILGLLFLMYYYVTCMPFEGFMVSNPKNTRSAVNRIKKWKSILKQCKKDNLVVMVPSIDPSTDKKIKALVEENLKPDLVTVITFANENVAKDFLAQIYAETVDEFPAYFKINDSDSNVNHVTLIREKTPAIENINIELEKYKDQMITAMKDPKKNMNNKTKDKNILNKGKNIVKDVLKTKPKEIFNKGKDIAKDILKTKPKNIFKKK